MNWQKSVLKCMEILFLGIGSYYDLKNQEIPTVLFPIFAAVGILFYSIWDHQSLQNLLAGICLGGIFLMTGWITKEAIGYGDGLGLMVLGIFEGWQGMIPIIFAAFLMIGIYSLWRLIGLKESRDTEIAFYPFLFAALLGVILL